MRKFLLLLTFLFLGVALTGCGLHRSSTSNSSISVTVIRASGTVGSTAAAQQYDIPLGKKSDWRLDIRVVDTIFESTNTVNLRVDKTYGGNPGSNLRAGAFVSVRGPDAISDNGHDTLRVKLVAGQYTVLVDGQPTPAVIRVYTGDSPPALVAPSTATP